MDSAKYKFQKLTPTPDAEIEVYEDALDFVFENSDIHNVALSGAYGAGKSSLLASYKAKHLEKKFLHISLAHFIPTDAADSQIPSDSKEKNIAEPNINQTPVKESILEGKILNQLLHQIPADKLPQSNFKVKHGVKPWTIGVLTAFTAACILGFFRIILRHQLQSFTKTLQDSLLKRIMVCLSQPYWIAVAAIICTAYMAWVIYKVIWLQKNRSIFKRINLHGNEIEIFEKQDESYFDKYLNEVLYVFENSGADVIVFEDMDRFNTSQIFERLHEINRLVNVQRMKAQEERPQKKKRKTETNKYNQNSIEKSSEHRNASCIPLRFFYLLRDDMFVSKDRTKFFDFILPVVPVVDSSNSYDKFLEIFKEAGYIERFSQTFLQGLALYVDDMRILKNICNEFTIYINRVNNIGLNWDKMLAIITYKNLFPRDFSDLQLGQGFVYELFLKKGELISQKLECLRATQKNLQKDIQYLNTRILHTPNELNDAENAARNRFDQRYYGLSDEKRTEYADYLRDFQNRKERSMQLLNNNLDELEKQLAEAEYDIQHLNAADLKDLITRENIGQLFSTVHINEIGQHIEFKEIKSSKYFPLLKFLIRNGYIDETYQDYLTYFYEESISAHDKIFLRRITDQLGAEYAYSLKAPEKIVECPVIQNVAFEQEETLNFDLLNYLLGHLDDSHNDKFVNILMAQLRNTRRFDFIVQYYGLNRSRQQFVRKLNEQWNGFFQAALLGNGLTESQVKQYSLDTLYYSSPEIIQAVNENGCLCEYISSTPAYLAIKHPEISKLIKGFDLLHIKIEKLTDEGVDSALLDSVYQRDLYVLNAENITFILKKQYGFEDETEFQLQNFTLISSQNEAPLYQYVLKKISTYAEVMLSICQNEIRDTEETIVTFLNFEEVTAEQKARYITAMTTKITELTMITDYKLWPQLMAKQKITPNAENMICFYLKYGLNEVLISYINLLPNNCDFSGIAKKFEESTRKKLFSAVVQCNAVTSQQYELVLTGLGFTFWDFSLNSLAKDKLSVLIQAGIMQMDKQTLQFIRGIYPDCRFEFIRCNWDAYLALQSNELFASDEIEEILNWNVADNQKLYLLSFAQCTLSIIGKSYSDEITAYILENCYKNSDFQELCRNYSSFGEQSKEKILKKAIEDQYQIYAYSILLDDSLLSELLLSKDVNEAYKVSLFENCLSQMTESNCKRHFEELGVPELCGIFDRYNSNRKYPKSEKVSSILDSLKQNRWIYSYSTDIRNPQKYVVTKNAPNHK